MCGGAAYGGEDSEGRGGGVKIKVEYVKNGRKKQNGSAGFGGRWDEIKIKKSTVNQSHAHI